MNIRRLVVISFFACFSVAHGFGQTLMPEPNPPFVPEARGAVLRPPVPSGAGKKDPPVQQWTLHKTPDGLHPNGYEQQMVWLMNRARLRPGVEGIWLAHLRQSNVQRAMDYFGLKRDVLMNEFLARSVSSPAAFDARLYLAASNHSAYLISIDGQNHNGQFQRITDQGFHYSSARGSVYAYSEDAIYGHAGFNADWGGNDGTGMQTGRGHREGVMGNYSCVGIANVEETSPATRVGPMVTTINYCSALGSYANHYNLFVVGTVWQDSNANSLYDAGEGRSNVVVMPDHGTFFAITGSAGGYAIPLTDGSGTYTLAFSGGGLPSNRTVTLTVGSASVLADLLLSCELTGMSTSAGISSSGVVTYTLTGQRKGWAYRLSTCTNLVSRQWTWAGVLPVGYGDTLTFSTPLIIANVPQRFLTLHGWNY